MLEKLLGLSDKSMMKKSNYYAYLFGALMGLVGIISGIVSLFFRYSDTYKGMILFQEGNIKYLKSLSQKMDDSRLINISELYAVNLNAITECYQTFNGFIIFVGFILIINFMLFKKLRNKLINAKE